ncbi:hypothetical protein RPIT_10375 [Tessaracoccus flavus]|uniref:Tryptophan-rich sensory protein n=2 Tax=Tessaracoccus flavus TaxID=1610493 RepID=A0A1Q2CGA1_9ACTN|nr:hypothetical protein RPIT_10375 [Tessaracoccus flavus]
MMNKDRLRQIWVTVAEILCVYGTLVGVGVLGSSVESSSDGALSADATLLAPGGTAFSIWSVIYFGLFAYTVWQWLPGNTTSPRARATGWLAGISMLLNAAWILVTQQGWIWVSVGVIAALVITLGIIMRRLTALPPQGWLDRVIVDGTFGAYLGWVSVATCANIAAAGVASGWSLGDGADDWLAVAVLAAAAGVGVMLAYTIGGRFAVAAAMAWGLSWIAIARLFDEPASSIVGIAAIIAVAVVVVVSGLRGADPGRVAVATA